MPTQTVFSASWGSWYSIFIHIYISICSTLRCYMPTQTVFSASWGSWYSIFIHIYIYIYVCIWFHTKMAHAHPNRFLCLVGFWVFYFYPYIYIYLFHTKMAHAHPNRFLWQFYLLDLSARGFIPCRFGHNLVTNRRSWESKKKECL